MHTRIWTIVLRCGLLLPLLFSFHLTSATAAETPPDLAALVIRPSDLESIGLPDVTVHRSILAERVRQAAEFTDDFNATYGTEAPTGTAIRRANPDWTYIQHLRTHRFYVIVTLMTHSDHRDAEQGMDAYVGTVEDWLRHEADQFELDGINSAVTFELESHDPRQTFNTIVFQQTAMVVVVQVWSVSPDDGVPVENVAVLQRDRLDEGELTGISDLVSQVLRLRVSGWNTRESAYWVLDGEAIRRYVEINHLVGYESRLDDTSSQGILDTHRSIQVVYGDWDSWSLNGPSGTVALLYIDIIAFDPESGAWTPERIRTVNAGYPEVAVPIEGYESYGMYSSAEGTVSRAQHTVWIWLDENTVVTFRHLVDVVKAEELDVDLKLDLDATNDLIQHQIACFEGTRSCDTVVRSPYTYGEES